MATLPAMVTAVSETDGRDRTAIEHVARFIRERGYIQNGKRGAGAPQMNSTDAANLLIALCGCDAPSEAPLAIDRFRSLRPMIEGDADMIRDYVDQIDRLPQPLRDVMQCQTFGTALETLIEGAPDLFLAIIAYLKEAHPGKNDGAVAALYKMKTAGLRIEFRRYSAAIRLFRTTRDGEVTDFLSQYIVDTKRPPGFYGADAAQADREVQVSVGIGTLLQLQSSITGAAD